MPTKFNLRLASALISTCMMGCATQPRNDGNTPCSTTKTAPCPVFENLDCEDSIVTFNPLPWITDEVELRAAVLVSIDRATREVRDSIRFPRFPVTTVNYNIYWLPNSVEPILSAGDNALPALLGAKTSSDLITSMLASYCIAIINGRYITKGALQVDATSNVYYRAYTVSSTPSLAD